MSELQELLGRACRITEDGSDQQSPSLQPQPTDITEAFYEECSKLKLGEVVFHPRYELKDAMSAVELLDPKMDIGIVRYERKVGIESLKTSGYFDKLTDKDVLTVFDGILCCFVSYLEGGNIANTLYTNVLMVDPDEVPNEILACVCHAFAHLVPMVRNAISSAMVFDEEDFNSTVPYLVTSKFTLSELLVHMKSIEEGISKKAETLGQDDQIGRYILLATSSRINWLRTVMDIMTAMLPPMPPQERTDSDVSLPEEKTKTSGSRKSPSPPPCFKPNLKDASPMAEKLTFIASTFVESTKLGARNPAVPDGFDGDDKFEWLEVFDPNFNKLHLSGSFPRKTIIPSREKAMLFLYQLSCRLHHIATKSRTHATDFSNFLGFFKQFGLDSSCVLTRSILQLVMLPQDEMVLGEVSLADLVEQTIKNTIKPMVLHEGTAAQKDEDCRVLFGSFVEEFTKAALTLVANFGMNLARQREKIGVCIEEISLTQVISDQLDRRTLTLMNNTGPEGHPMHPIMGFVFNQLVNLISYHFELTFRLELFAPHEYISVYWYLAEIMSRWHINTLERLQEVYFYDYKVLTNQQNQAVGSGKKKKNSRRADASANAAAVQEELIRARVDYGQSHMIRRYGEAALAQGISFSTLALVLMDKIQAPKWDDNSDKMRFEHRMAPFRCLGPPLHLTYDQYITVSKVNVLKKKGPEPLLAEAMEYFENSLKQFSQLTERAHANSPELTRVAQVFVRICKSNIIALKVLTSGNMANRRVEWAFTEPSIPYPVLKFQ